MRYASLFLFFLLFLLLSCAGTSKSSAKNGTLPPENPRQVKHSQNEIPQELYTDAAHESFLRGQNLLNRGSLDGALLFFEQARQFDTTSRFLAFRLSELYRLKGKTKKALEVARQGMAIPGEASYSELLHLARLFEAMPESAENADSATYYFGKAVELQDDDPPVLLEYSMLLQKQEKYKELADVYHRLLPMLNFPSQLVEKQLLLCMMIQDSTCVLRTLGSAWEGTRDEQYGVMYIEALLKQKQYDKALDVVTKMRGAFPEDVSLAIRRAQILVMKDQMDSALAELQQARSIDTTSDDVLRTLARVEFELGRNDSARVHLQELLRRSPNEHELLYMLGLVSFFSDQKDSAIASMQQAIALSPDNFMYYHKLHSFYLLQDQYDQAFALSDTLVARFPKFPASWVLKARAKTSRAGDTDNSLAAHQGDSAEVLQQRIASDRQEAHDDLQQALTLDSLNPQALFAQASLWERRGNFDSSAVVFETLIRLHPEHHQALNYYGYMLIDADKDVPRGRILVDSALVYDPDNSAYLDSKAWYLYRMQEYQKALEVMESIEDPGASNWEYYEHLALILEALGRQKEALGHWQKVLEIRPWRTIAQERLKASGGGSSSSQDSQAPKNNPAPKTGAVEQ